MSGCATAIVSPEPYQCPILLDEILNEYEMLMTENKAPQLRAWVRETEKVCRANAALLQE